MKLDKKIISKALCYSAVCCVLLTNIAFAEDSDGEAKKATVSINNADSFNKVIEQKNIYAEAKNPLLEKEYLDKAKAIADKIPNDKGVQYDYHINLSNFYGSYGNSYESVKELEKALKYLDTTNIDSSVFLYNQLARYYTETYDFNKADLMLKKKAKILKNNDIPDGKSYKVSDYATRMYFYQGQGNLSVILPAYKEGKKLIDTNNFDNIDLSFELNGPLISYYLCTHNMEGAKSALDYHLDLAKKENKDDQKSFVLGEYATYYKTMRDENNAKKVLKKLIKTNNKVYPENSIGNIETNTQRIEFYQYIGNVDKAEALAIKNVNIAEQFKEIAPAVYAGTLKQLSETKLQADKIAESLAAIKVAKEYYLKALPEISQPLYGTENQIANIYLKIGDYDNALSHYKSAKNILDKLTTKPFIDHIDVYSQIANVYTLKGNTEKAITEINNAINVSKSTFGENNIRTLYLQLDKAYIYKNAKQCALAKNQIDNILEKISSGKVSDTDDIEFQCYMFLANGAFEKGNYDDALANVTKALQNPFTDENKNYAEAFISKIYKVQDKKFKSLKHKIKSKI